MPDVRRRLRHDDRRGARPALRRCAAGAEAGVRAAEDLATWAYCEAVAGGTLLPNGKTNCAQEGAIPHALLETTPGQSVTAGDALRRTSVWLAFANPDGWRRGDPDNLARFYQRYNGNGVDLNRDWPTIGFTFRPYTPWSEPETRHFGRVLKQIRDRWDGGIDLHGQLVDRAFSFTLMGASERDYAKDQRILQTVKGAWADAEQRLADPGRGVRVLAAIRRVEAEPSLLGASAHLLAAASADGDLEGSR